jgi:hypothetical protein
VYTELKAMTRGKTFTAEDLARVVATLPADKRSLLRDMKPKAYLGDAVRSVDEVLETLPCTKSWFG